MPITVRPGLIRKTCAIAVGLFLAAVEPACGSAPDPYVPLPASQPIPMDNATYEWIGREALARYGYEEIIRVSVEAGALYYPIQFPTEQTNAGNLVGQTIVDAARAAGPVFTKWAVRAAITTQLDSPAPGPADFVALGMLVVGIGSAAFAGAKVLTSSTTATATAVPTATATTTTTSPPVAVPRKYPNQTCDNARLKTLQKLKDVACNSQKWTCSDTFERIGKVGEKLLTCAELLPRIPIGTACLAARKQIQTECFIGAPDPTHEDEIKKAIDALADCTRKAAIRGPGGGPCKP